MRRHGGSHRGRRVIHTAHATAAIIPVQFDLVVNSRVNRR